jgi:hypothetical protein
MFLPIKYKAIFFWIFLNGFIALHSGGNDRFCARLKTDISAFNSGLRGRTRSCLTFLERGRIDESKRVRHDLR